jgi:DNA-binding NarL/FixJ family response regulator
LTSGKREKDVKRVLVGGELEAIMKTGLHDLLLADEECEVVAEPDGAAIFDFMVEASPDVVVLDEEQGGTELAGIIASEYPTVTVIACSSLEPTMRVFFGGESYASVLSPESLIEAVRQA